MFKVFLVDDEEWVIESLKASVKWNQYGFEIVGYALRGAEAFEAIGQLQSGCRLYRYSNARHERVGAN